MYEIKTLSLKPPIFGKTTLQYHVESFANLFTSLLFLLNFKIFDASFPLEIPNFLTDEECQTIIKLASREGLDTSEVQDPETGINIEPTNEKTFHSWDYNSDGVIDKVEVCTNEELS